MTELNEVQKLFIERSVVGSWSIDLDKGLIDVDGRVLVSYTSYRIHELPVAFGTVLGNFEISSRSHLRSLKGLPQKVDGNLNIYFNEDLEDLGELPEYIGGYLGIDLREFDESIYETIIPQIQLALSRGIKINNHEDFYQKPLEKWLEKKSNEVMLYIIRD